MLLSHSVSYTVSEEAFVSYMSYGVSYGVYVGFGEIVWYFLLSLDRFLYYPFVRGFSKILREGFS